jgi:multimeric flavodoxin WrbA
MGKKILVLAASPRKGGNSDILCGEFIKGAEETGHETEKIYIKDKEINYCLGCGVCRENGICVHTDDMTEMLEKMFSCDILVLATPVYYYSMNAQMKTLIDRCFSIHGLFAHGFSKTKKQEIYIIVTGGANAEHYFNTAVEGLRGFISCLPGMQEKGIIYGINAGEAGTVKDTPAMGKAYEMGKMV